MKTILIMDIVVVFFGIYLAVNAAQMKRSGRVSSFVVPEQEMKKCKNPKAYINGIVPYMYFFSVISMLVGGVGILCDINVLNIGKTWVFLELASFLIALAGFVRGMRAMKTKYFY